MRFAIAVLSLIAPFLDANLAVGSGGPENLALVVNAESWASLAVANHYAALRGVPPGNVVYLSDLPSNLSIDVNQFRDLVLLPVLQTLENRGLAGQIDCIAYSADLPYSVNVQADIGDKKLPKVITPEASINGLTFLYPLVLARNPGYLSLTANRYYRQGWRPEEGFAHPQPARAFRGARGWSEAGEPVAPSEGPRHLLSTMLAVTSGRGNSLAEAEACLTRSVGADGTCPRGSVYYLENGDIRSKTRKWGFASAAARLKAMGIQAEVLQGVLPEKRPDVVGAMIGAAAFDWKASQSVILPGAICEHLTSCGGILRENGGQTPLSALLRHGAAGSSGTVTEPYAIQHKFPTPFLHVFYASGCTLAEAFYQSVRGPYQLLIVGDPLCRPWAQTARARIVGPPPGARVKGELTLQLILEESPKNSKGKPAATGSGDSYRNKTGRLSRWELYVDGRRHVAVPPGQRACLSTDSLAEGHHEIRAVAVSDDTIETQNSATLPIVVDRRGLSLEVNIPSSRIRLDETVSVHARMAGAKRLALSSNGRELASISGPEGNLAVPAARLGLGKTRIEVNAVLNHVGGPGGKSDVYLGPTVECEIERPKALTAIAPPAGLVPGLKISPAGGRAQIVENLQKRDWLLAAVKPAQEFALEGLFDVPAEDMYQFQVRTSIPVDLAVDGRKIAPDGKAIQYYPMALAPGMHRLKITGRGADKAALDVWFGGPGALAIGSGRFRVEK